MTGNIHFVLGESGDLGGSLFCRCLIEYFQQDSSLSLVVIDRENGVMQKTYAADLSCSTTTPNDWLSQIALINFSNNGDNYSPDVIVELAMLGKTVVINLSNLSCSGLINWVDSLNLINLASQFQVKLWNWLVVDGSSESMTLLKQFYQTYGDQINQIVVKNHNAVTQAYGWSLFNKDLQSLKGLCCLEMPKLMLPSYRWDVIKKESLTLFKATELRCRGITLTEKHKLHIWLKKMFQDLSLILKTVQDNELIYND